MKNKKKSNKIIWIIGLLVGGFIFKLFRIFCKKKEVGENFKKFLAGEKREIKELRTGKESFNRYCGDTCKLFKDYFIPHDGNNHKPKILHQKSLAVIVILLLIVKISVTGYLYFLYPNQAKMSAEITGKLLELTNQDRIANGMNALTLNSTLSASAMAKADDMAIKDYFAHHSPEGIKPWDWINRDEYAYLLVGENLAINFTSAEAVHKALMDSESHKKNILNERYQDVGLAVISGELNGKVTNILVELFSVRKAPSVAVNTNMEDTAGTTEKDAIVETSEETRVLAEENTETSPQIITPERKPEPKKLVEATIQEEPKFIPPVDDFKNMQDEAEFTEPKVINSDDWEVYLDPEVELIAQTSPNPELETNPNTEVSYYKPMNTKKIGFATKVVSVSRYIYLGALILITLALIINIIIRISIQHRSVIIQTVVVILLIAGLLSVRLHVLENIGSRIALI